MTKANIIISCAVAAVVSQLLLQLLLRYRHLLPVDQPNHRSLHSKPIPRTGGIAIIGGLVTGWILLDARGLDVAIASALLLGMVFLFDDIRGLSVRFRLCTQLLVSAAFLWLHVGLDQGPLIFLLCVFAIAWTTNVFNFMDGSDGLAGGMTVFAFGFYALGAWNVGREDLSAIGAVLCASTLMFLILNFHPAKIFLGDVGSIPLGFLAASIGMQGWIEGVWPLGFPAIILSPFLVDATFTLFRRILRREKAWNAHREHMFQKLIIMGVGHRNTALIEYLLMLVCGLGGMILLRRPELQDAMILGWAIGYAVFIGLVEVAWRRRSLHP